MHIAYAPLGKFWSSECEVMQKCIGYAPCLCTSRQVLEFKVFGHAEVHRLCALLMQISAERENARLEVMQKCISYAPCLCTSQQVLIFGEFGHAVVHRSCTPLMQISVERENVGFEVMQICISYAHTYASLGMYEI